MATQSSKPIPFSAPTAEIKTVRTRATPRAAKKQVAPLTAAPRKTIQKTNPTISQNQTNQPEEAAALSNKQIPETSLKYRISAKTLKPRKIKKTRVNFIIPKDEINTITNLKLRATQLSLPSKKSVLLRAGIKSLAAMSDKNLIQIMQSLSETNN